MKRRFQRLLKAFFIGQRRQPNCRQITVAASGSVSVELALVAVFLATLAIGAFDFARYGIEQTRLTNAARAGSQYALQGQVSAADKVAIEQAVRDDADDGDDELNVTVGDIYCSCPVDGAVACSTTCSDGGYAPMYVDVTVTNDVGLLFRYPGIDSSLPISATSRLRVR